MNDQIARQIVQELQGVRRAVELVREQLGQNLISTDAILVEIRALRKNLTKP
jgi:hypothetical protein